MDKATAKKLGERIRKARKDIGMSQRELSENLKVSDKAVSSYEVGRTTPNFAQIKRISKVLHKPINYFDADSDSEDLDLQIQLKNIERELLEVKKALIKRGKI